MLEFFAGMQVGIIIGVVVVSFCRSASTYSRDGEENGSY